MSYTENLNLRIIDDSDTYGDFLAQGNAIAEQLENLFGANYSDYQNLSLITTEINSLNNDVTTLGLRCDELDSRINSINAQLGNRITAIENGKGFYINEDGERIDGTITRYIIEATASGSRGELPINETSTERDIIVSLNGSVILNLTELIGLISMQNKKLINANCYISTFDTNRGSIPAFSLNGIYKPPYQNYYVISFTTEKTTIAHQTYNPGSSSWLPSIPGNYQDMPVIVSFDIFEESDLPE